MPVIRLHITVEIPINRNSAAQLPVIPVHAVSCRFSIQIHVDLYESGGMQCWTVLSATSTHAHVEIDPRRVVTMQPVHLFTRVN